MVNIKNTELKIMMKSKHVTQPTMKLILIQFNFKDLNKIIMNSKLRKQQNEWAILLKLQQQKIEQRERMEKQDSLQRKRKYKMQLQNQINENRSKAKNIKLSDIELMQNLHKVNKLKQQEQNRLYQKSYEINQKILFENLQTKQQKIQKQIAKKAEEKRKFQQLIKRKQLQHQMQLNDERQLKRRQKTQLALAYQNKIQETENLKLRNKLQDKIYMKNGQKILQNTQFQRKQQLFKIRYGYNQNPEIYNFYSQLIKKKESQTTQNLENLILPIMNIEKKRSLTLDHLDEELFSTNSRNLSEKNELEALKSIKAKSPQQLQKIKQLQKKIQFRRQLKLQIQQKQRKKSNNKRMDNLELLYNKKSFQGDFMLPGFSNDYHKLKQRQILNRAVGIEKKFKTIEGSQSKQTFY